ncbi:(2Fe-2S) ferredoxin domain-containing protein [Victivallis vadensis]|uniref:(2Fe-2S) ferredoxin domain-containing protein n=1 Tax=Victivallis vadensis TaxID=172901 RepID=UPI00307EEBC2
MILRFSGFPSKFQWLGTISSHFFDIFLSNYLKKTDSDVNFHCAFLRKIRIRTQFFRNTTMAKPKIVICLGSSCFARGNEENIRVVEAYLAENSYRDEVEVELSGTLCQARCADGPNVIIDGVTYSKVDPGVMLDLLRKTLPPRGN